MKKLILNLFAICLIAASCSAFVRIDGLTFTVADAAYFHSSSTTPLPNLAEVGEMYYGGAEEQARGMSEFDITGLTLPAAKAYVQFEVVNDGGLFFTNDFSFDGNIAAEMYRGNNTEDLTDFWIPSFVQVADISTTGLMVGQTLMVEVTEALNYAMSKGDSALGIRLQADPLYYVNGGAWTFGDFEMLYTAVPEARTTGALALVGLGVMLFALRRRRLA